MAKKEKISIQRDATLELVDEELESAMNLLDGANQKVTNLLSSYVAPPPANDAGEATDAETEGRQCPVDVEPDRSDAGA